MTGQDATGQDATGQDATGQPTDADVSADCARELSRVVDRLGSMPLNRAGTATDTVMAIAEVLLAEGRRLGVPVPDDAALVPVQPQGLAALIAVLGRDCLEAARASRDADLGPVRDALVSLRRALP